MTVAARAIARCWGLAIALAACNGKPRPEEATRPAVRDAAAAVARDASAVTAGAALDAGAGAGPAAGGLGDLQVRVEWRDVPVVARTSPGRTPCGAPRAPSVAPTTTWGVPEALVIIEGAGAGAGAGPEVAQVTLADCALAPRIAVGASLAITSAVDRPARLALRKRGAIDRLAAGDPIPVMLPIAGHTVTTALDPGAIYALETSDPAPELAFVAAIPGAFVSDASGHVLVSDLAVGAHAVTAWLPPRAGQPARIGRGTATITAGDLAEITIALTP